MLSDSREASNCIQLSVDFRLGLGWWRKFFPNWNGSASFLEINRTTADAIELFMDASAALGFAGYFNSRWFQSRWPDWLKAFAPSIKFLEMLPILAACSLWKKEFARRKIVLHCHNLGVTQAWSNLGTRCRNVLSVMRSIFLVAAEANFTLTMKHISG